MQWGFCFHFWKSELKHLLLPATPLVSNNVSSTERKKIEPKIKDEKDCWLQLYKIHVQAAKLRQLQLYKLCRSDSVCLSLCLCVCVNPVCVL